MPGAPSNVSQSRVARRLARLAATATLGAVALVAGPGIGLGGAAALAGTPAGPAMLASLPGQVSATSAVLPDRKTVSSARAAFGRSVLAEAARHAGAPYAYGASGPGAFDCSGFTRYVFARMGVALAHSSYSQYAEVTHIPRSAALPGDIVFLNGLGHVGIYAGHGMMWDAPSPGGSVSLRPIYSSAYSIGRVRL